MLVLAWTGCVRREPRADLVILNGAEIESLDPAIVTGQPDLRAVAALFEGLLRNDPANGQPIPGLAGRWDISSDGRVYTFHLRPDAVWSTGEPITAADVVYSWHRVLDPATASDYAGQLFPVRNAEAYNSGRLKDPGQVGVRALDPHTVRVELEQPTAYFLDLCAFPTLAVVPRQTIQRHGDRWILARPLPVSGAYELVAWRLNDKIRLCKNPRYWDAAHTRTGLIDLLPVGSASAALNLYMTGGADIAWDKELVPVDLVDALMTRPDFHTYDYLGTYFIRFNVTRKPFNDPRVRRALALAIDKQRIVQRITRAGERVASSLCPSGMAHYQPPDGLGYDPAEARRLLAAAGYPGGKGFPAFDYLFNSAAGGAANMHQKIAVEFQQMWESQLGIHVDLRQTEWKVYLEAQSRLDYDTCRSSWIGDYDDPNTFLGMFTSDNGNNRTGWTNAMYDHLLRAANRQIDPVPRRRLLQQAETLLVRDEVPIIPIFFYKGMNYFDARSIHGIYLDHNLLDLHPLNAIWKTPAQAPARTQDLPRAARTPRDGIPHLVSLHPGPLGSSRRQPALTASGQSVSGRTSAATGFASCTF
ncbi:MAG: peptide ABC transporter substrate-binding protein [Verrucomicrobia bacterium]|nr:peptide ABC transporter substrate-binding protein [Verrucomicrobiota bacterium]